MAQTPREITVQVRTQEAGEELARQVEWVLNDLVYTAPEAIDRIWRDMGVLQTALEDFKKAPRAIPAEPRQRGGALDESGPDA